MPKARKEEQEFGSESFLDVMANVVGILIILVMVVGMRIQKSIAETTAAEEPVRDISAPLAELRSLESDALRQASQSSALQREALARRTEQDQLAAELADRKRQLDEQRRALSQQAQQEFDARRDLAAAQALANDLERDLAAASQSKQTITIESFPTPIARTVKGDEAHFQIRGGRIAFIPLDELIARLKADAPSHFWKLKDLPEATASVGPINGFRLRYTFQKVDEPLEDLLSGKRMIRTSAQLSQWTLIPVEAMLGETADEALAPQSEFRLALSKLNPRQSTVTLWIYPESFDAFRRVRKELYHLGFPTAGRPLPADAPIAGSPNGSKSAAQ